MDKEFSLALKNMCRENMASLPDDVHGRVLGTTLLDLRGKLTKFLNTCLRTDSFSNVWKVANLVLILIPGKKRWIPHRRLGRRICHLIKVGNVLERIVAYKITSHLSYIGEPIRIPDGPLQYRRDRYGSQLWSSSSYPGRSSTAPVNWYSQCILQLSVNQIINRSIEAQPVSVYQKCNAELSLKKSNNMWHYGWA